MKDLLADCNDQNMPPQDFKAMFCARCRNKECVNAGWSGSAFEQRIASQEDRLLINPVRARPDDPQFAPIRAQHFRELEPALVLARLADPWAGPGVHLSAPEPLLDTTRIVEDAVAKLTKTDNPVPPKPVQETTPAPIAAPAQVLATPVVENPGMNTDFPDEGVMIGGGSPSNLLVVTDPWAPKPKMNVVPRGAKIRMDG